MLSRPKDVSLHCRQVHHIEAEADDIAPGWMQQLSLSPLGKSWFSVTARSSRLVSPEAAYLTGLRRQLDIRPSLPASELDHRHLSTWHMTTRWMQYIEEKDPARMLALIDVPKENEPFFSLIQYVRDYVEEAYALIPHTSEVCLQILNTDTMTT